MANHKKSPIFLRIKASEKEVVCINPLQLASFRIVYGYEVKNRDQQPIGTGDTLFFYLPAGTFTRYTAGIEITQAEFDYVSSAMAEYLYLTKPEFHAKKEMINKAKLAEYEAATTEK